MGALFAYHYKQFLLVDEWKESQCLEVCYSFLEKNMDFLLSVGANGVRGQSDILGGGELEKLELW